MSDTVPYEDEFEVYFTMPQPRLEVSLWSMYDVGRTMQALSPVLFPRVGWCSAAQSGFDVLIPKTISDQRLARYADTWQSEWQHRFGATETRGHCVFQIRIDHGPSTPKGEYGASHDEMVTRLGFEDPKARITFPSSRPLDFMRSPRQLVPCMWARIKYGATAQHAAAFAAALEENGFLVVTTVGFEFDSDGNVVSCERGKVTNCLSNETAAALRKAYLAAERSSAAANHYTKHRDAPY